MITTIIINNNNNTLPNPCLVRYYLGYLVTWLARPIPVATATGNLTWLHPWYMHAFALSKREIATMEKKKICRYDKVK